MPADGVKRILLLLLLLIGAVPGVRTSAEVPIGGDDGASGAPRRALHPHAGWAEDADPCAGLGKRACDADGPRCRWRSRHGRCRWRKAARAAAHAALHSDDSRDDGAPGMPPSPPSPRPFVPALPTPTAPCASSFTRAAYEALDADLLALQREIRDDDAARGHFLGGIVRLAAHDLMDYDPGRARGDEMGPDGCFDPDHRNNAGLSRVWCDGCPLQRLHARRYGHVSRADFWVAAANAAIRQTSGGALDLRDTFRWGRRDRDECGGSGARLPRPAGCRETEEVFLRRMGLSWRDVTALLGAHTLGRGDRRVSSVRAPKP